MRIYTNVLCKTAEVLAVIFHSKAGHYFICNKHFTPSLYTQDDFIYLPPKLVTHHSWGDKVDRIWTHSTNKKDYLRQLKLSQSWVSLSDFEKRLHKTIGKNNTYLTITSQVENFKSLFPQEKVEHISDYDLAWNKIFKKYVK